MPLAGTPYAENIYWVYGMVADTEALQQKIVACLSAAKIGTRPFFWCMHEQPVFQNMGLFKNEKYPVAENMARNGFYVPSGLGMSNEDAKEVCAQIHNSVKQAAA